MKRNAIVVMLALAFASMQASADETPEMVEVMRKDLVERVKTQQALLNIPTEIVDEYISIVGDDTRALDVGRIRESFKALPGTPDARFRRLAYVTGLLFRERDNPKLVTELFDSMTKEERLTIVGLLTTKFSPFINRTYFPLAKKGLFEAVADAEPNPERNVQDQQGREELALSWIDVLAVTGQGDSDAIMYVLQHKVLSPELRFNAVARSMSRMRGRARPVAVWYFQTYAWKPFEVKVIAEYLQKYMEPASLSGLLSGKSQALKGAHQSLQNLGVAEPVGPTTRPER